jgi:CheY-like chemotaxis protein
LHVVQEDPAVQSSVPPVAARVLVVDDDPIVRDVLVRLTRAVGCEADGVADLPSALASLAASAPDVVLLDLSVVRDDVAGAAARMRAAGARSIVLVSGAGVVHDPSTGTDGVLAKPLSLERLRDAVLARVPAGVG